MNDPVTIAVLAAAVFAIAFLGVLVLWLRERGQSVKLATELAGAVERARLQEDARATMGDYLRAQAEQTATATAEALLKRTDETFRNREMLHQERLAAQLKPVADTLTKFEAQVQALEKTRAEETGGLKEQLALLMSASNATRDEARKLTEALRGNTGRRGRWGEQTCRNVLEAAGMAGRFDFDRTALQPV
jgi:DNA recombination protein RmuC